MGILAGPSRATQSAVASVTVVQESRPPGAASQASVVRWAGSASSRPQDSFDRVARLAAMALGRSLASVTIVGSNHSSEPVRVAARTSGGGPGPTELSLRQYVIDSGNELIIDDAATGLPAGLARSGDLAAPMACVLTVANRC